MTTLRIHEIFTQTIQGEGFMVGTPSDFVRLWGCPVKCRWCDTGYSDGGKSIPWEEVEIPEILERAPGKNIVITGGEPFICNELSVLVAAFRMRGCHVQIETSGAYYQPVNAHWITLSPKTHATGKPVIKEFWETANEVKIVVNDRSDFEFYLDPLAAHGWQGKPVFVQPCWENGMMLEPCLGIVQEYPWVRISIQLHKLLGMP
jgi:organic radical activating enzyme